MNVKFFIVTKCYAERETDDNDECFYKLINYVVECLTEKSTLYLFSTGIIACCSQHVKP